MIVKNKKAARSYEYFKYIDDIRKPVNKMLKKQVSDTINIIGKVNDMRIKSKIFLLDHTAEVLENFRRLQEYNIWKRDLHYEREKVVAIK